MLLNMIANVTPFAVLFQMAVFFANQIRERKCPLAVDRFIGPAMRVCPAVVPSTCRMSTAPFEPVLRSRGLSMPCRAAFMPVDGAKNRPPLMKGVPQGVLSFVLNGVFPGELAAGTPNHQNS